MTRSSPHLDKYRTELFSAIDKGGRLAIGRAERRLGTRFDHAYAFATPSRLVVRFSDDPTPPPGWVRVPVVRKPGRSPELRFTGRVIKPLLQRAGLVYPVHVRVTASVEASQIIVKAAR